MNDLIITPSASQALQKTLEAKSAAEGTGLRLGVRRGGCAGWQYTMQISSAEEGDITVQHDGAPVYLAADSVDKLAGCQLDYSNALSDAGFKITNPNAARSCGCGTSFETQAESENSSYNPDLDGIACKE